MTLEGGWLVCTGSLHESQADTGPNYLSPVFGHSRVGAKAQELKAPKHKYKFVCQKIWTQCQVSILENLSDEIWSLRDLSVVENAAQTKRRPNYVARSFFLPPTKHAFNWVEFHPAFWVSVAFSLQKVLTGKFAFRCQRRTAWCTWSPNTAMFTSMTLSLEPVFIWTGM